MKERRYKIVRMDESLLVEIWNWHLSPPNFIALPISEELPEGTRVVSANYNHSWRALELCVEHESFPDVCPGSLVPAIPTALMDVRHVLFRDVNKERVDLIMPEPSYGKVPLEKFMQPEASE